MRFAVSEPSVNIVTRPRFNAYKALAHHSPHPCGTMSGPARICGRKDACVGSGRAARHDAFHAGRGKLVAQYFLVKTWEKVERHNVRVEFVVRLKRFFYLDFAQCLALEVYAEAYFGKFGIIVAFESIEIVGRTLGGAVASPKVVLEPVSPTTTTATTDLWYFTAPTRWLTRHRRCRSCSETCTSL